MKNIFLSKTNYCKSIQCPKIVWLKKYKPKEAIQKADPKLFENGKKVGKIAQDIFGKKHEDIQYNKNYQQMIEKTKEYLHDKPNIITEATFKYNNNFCMVDILKNDTDGVEIYEVKSSTKVTDIYIDDASFQYYVLNGLGYNVKKVAIVYINSQYTRQKELELDKLFNIKDITDTVHEKQEEIHKNIEQINEYMKKHDKTHEPKTSIGNHCSNPYDCDFWEYCTKNTEKTNLQEQEENIDKKAIKELLGSLKYPLYFIDYETYNTPLPENEGTHPYQQIPFQYSLHIIKEEGAKPEHKQFLAQTDDPDFIRHFAENMTKDLSGNGSIIVYNKSFECGNVNKKLIEMYPDLKDEIERINNNMIDFMMPFKKKQYYTKQMQNSHSLKYVLPALYPDNPELVYDKLHLIHNGEEASTAFQSLKNKTKMEQNEIRQALLKYCELDTYALVKIYEKFREVVK